MLNELYKITITKIYRIEKYLVCTVIIKCKSKYIYN